MRRKKVAGAVGGARDVFLRGSRFRKMIRIKKEGLYSAQARFQWVALKGNPLPPMGFRGGGKEIATYVRAYSKCEASFWNTDLKQTQVEGRISPARKEVHKRSW